MLHPGLEDKRWSPASAGLPPGPLEIPSFFSLPPSLTTVAGLFVQPRQPTLEMGAGAAESGPVPLPGAHLYAEGIRRNLPWPRPRELLAP